MAEEVAHAALGQRPGVDPVSLEEAVVGADAVNKEGSAIGAMARRFAAVMSTVVAGLLGMAAGRPLTLAVTRL